MDKWLSISALRAKIAEMREMSLTQEHEIRERIKDEYHQLVENLFSATYKLRKRYDLFRYWLKYPFNRKTCLL